MSLVPPETASGSVGSWSRYLAGDVALWAWAAVSLAIMPFMRAHSRK
jgi:hypothetical protein